MAFSNRDQLRRRLKAIPIEVRKAVRAQMKANADQLVETQKRFADAVFADPTGALQGTIRHQDTSTSTRISRRVSAGGVNVPYAAWVEFGTKGAEAEAPRQNRNYRRTVVMTKARGTHHATQPKPFFWPAYRLLKRRMKSRMTRAAKKAITEAASK